MDKIVGFADQYSFYGLFDNTALIYNSDDNTLLFHSKVNAPGLKIEDYDFNYMDSNEYVQTKVITIDENVKNLHVVLLNVSCENSRLFNSNYKKLEYVIPDNAPIDEIKKLIYQENKNLNKKNKDLKQTTSFVFFKIIKSNDFYLKTNPLYDEELYDEED